MCLCCILHCDGSCNLQPGRVVKNGKSCYVGHCNTSAQCIANLSIYEKQQALIEFNKRCADCKASEDEVSEDEVLKDEVLKDSMILWYTMYCSLCNNTINSTYFYRGVGDIDYCLSCFGTITDNLDKYEKWSCIHIRTPNSPARAMSFKEVLERFGHSY
jgi:hypothetical protein